MNANIDIKEQRQKSIEVEQLLEQMSDLDEKITARDNTAKNNNWIGGLPEKNMWDAATQTLRNSLKVMQGYYSLMLLKWAQQLN